MKLSNVFLDILEDNNIIRRFDESYLFDILKSQYHISYSMAMEKMFFQ